MNLFNKRELLLTAPHVVPSLPTRWRHCTTNERTDRTSSSKQFSGLCGDGIKTVWLFLSAPEWVIHTITKGFRLQFAKDPTFQRSSLFSYGRELRSHSERRNLLPPRERCWFECLPRTLQTGFYSHYFPVPNNDGSLRPILDLSVEQTFEEIQFQNVNTRLSLMFSNRLVHIIRSKKMLFST